MDPVTLTAFLAPYFPYLLKGAKFVGEEAGKAFAQEGWQAAQRLWGKLRSRFGDDSDELKAADTLADDPEDKAAEAALTARVAALLSADPALLAELETIWRETEPARVAVAKERGVAVAGDVRGSYIVTGDNVDIGQ